MPDYHAGDRVKIDLPNESNPNHDPYHEEHGTIVDSLEDDSNTLGGDEQDSNIYRIHLDAGEKLEIRHLVIRPPIQ